MKISVLTLFTTFSFCSATVWNAEDALILEIDAVVQNNTSSASSEEVTDPTTLSPDDGRSCVTNEGVEGVCIKFTECYPYFKIEVKDTKQMTTADHIEVVKNMSTPCVPPTPVPTTDHPHLSPGDEGPFSNYDHVCCATLSRAAHHKLPKFAPEEKKPDVENVEDMENVDGAAQTKAGCGVTPYLNDAKVTRGREAKMGEFPWAVALFFNGRHHCGGSLIDANHVVTAAHCVNTIRTSSMLQNLRLYIGAHDIYATSGFEVRKVKKLAFHKGFNGQGFRDDIALMVLDTPVKLSTKIQPVCLHTGSPSYDGGKTQADISGWGKISEHGPPSRKLRTANIRIWTNAQCAQKYQGTLAPPISSGMVCAGLNGMDSCQGDSGGPLTLQQSGREHLVGIVSWGIQCGVYPGVYTRVDKYIPWIEKYKAKLA